MKPRILTSALLGIGLSLSVGASAQDQVWLKDRRYTEGAGIRAGDFELHPGVAGEFGYDTNYFLRSDRDQQKPVDAYRLRITPSFGVTTAASPQRAEGEAPGEPPKVNVSARAAATYNYPFAAKSENSEQFKGNRGVGILSDLKLAILPGRPWGADVVGGFMRTIQPSNNADDNFNRFTARIGGGVIWAPGGGMFDWRLGYQFTTTYFEDATFRNLGNHEHQVNTRGRWRFLPRTALLYDASLGFIRYDSAGSGQFGSNPVRARLGLNGLVTPSISFLAMAGWGSSFYRSDNAARQATAQQFDSVIAQAELRWFMGGGSVGSSGVAASSLSSMAIGYTRDFANSYLGDYYTIDRGYASVQYSFNGRFVLVLDGGVAAHEYPLAFYLNRTRAHAPFTALYADATLFGEYRVTDSFGINTTLRYSANITDAAMQVGGINGTPISFDYLEWKRFEAYLGVRWFL